MPPEQIIIGAIIAFSAGLGFFQQSWLLESTKWGARLRRWFGEAGAPWALRALLVIALTFGTLLATDVIRPIRW